MAEQKEFIVAIELGSSKVTGIAGQKKPDGSISVLALAREDSSSFIRKGVVYNIDKTAQCLTTIVKKLEGQLKTHITQVFVGVGGQSIRGTQCGFKRPARRYHHYSGNGCRADGDQPYHGVSRPEDP